MESLDNILFLHEINIENPLTVAKARNISTKLTHAGAVLIGADILLSGEIKPSHLINGAMLGVSTTGVGTIIAGVWFIADYGTMGINYIFTGEAKGISDMIDESIGTYELACQNSLILKKSQRRCVVIHDAPPYAEYCLSISYKMHVF